jgi:cbb3-type cytochrome oxidase subunit 3
MELHVLSGVITGVLLVLYTGLVIWAWDRRRAPEFERAARLPFADDQAGGD